MGGGSTGQLGRSNAHNSNQPRRPPHGCGCKGLGGCRAWLIGAPGKRPNPPKPQRGGRSRTFDSNAQGPLIPPGAYVDLVWPVRPPHSVHNHHPPRAHAPYAIAANCGRVEVGWVRGQLMPGDAQGLASFGPPSCTTKGGKLKTWVPAAAARPTECTRPALDRAATNQTRGRSEARFGRQIEGHAIWVAFGVVGMGSETLESIKKNEMGGGKGGAGDTNQRCSNE